MTVLGVIVAFIGIAAAIFLLGLLIYIGFNGFKSPREWRGKE